MAATNQPGILTKAFNLYMSSVRNSDEAGCNNDGILKPYTNDEVLQIMTIVHNAKIKPVTGKPLLKFKYNLSDIYDVIEVSNANSLQLVVKSSQREPIFVLSCEDAFTKLLAIHNVYDHADSRKMHSTFLVQNPNVKVYRLESCIDAIIGCCEECKPTSKVTKLEGFNYKCYVSIRLLFENDQCFKHVLIVADRETNFVRLRPIAERNVTQVALVLFKIFTDYGPPSIIETEEVEFILEVGEILYSLLPEFTVHVMKAKPTDGLISWDDIVVRKIKQWQSVVNNPNWVVSCHAVQWMLNTKYNADTLEIPYNNVFNCRSVFDIFNWDEGTVNQSAKGSDKNEDKDTIDACAVKKKYRREKKKNVNPSLFDKVTSNSKNDTNTCNTKPKSFGSLFDLHTDDISDTTEAVMTNTNDSDNEAVVSSIQSVDVSAEKKHKRKKIVDPPPLDIEASNSNNNINTNKSNTDPISVESSIGPSTTISFESLFDLPTDDISEAAMNNADDKSSENEDIVGAMLKKFLAKKPVAKFLKNQVTDDKI